MKRFLLFAGDHGFPKNGFRSFRGHFSTYQEALLEGKRNNRFDWFQIVDMFKLIISNFAYSDTTSGYKSLDKEEIPNLYELIHEKNDSTLEYYSVKMLRLGEHVDLGIFRSMESVRLGINDFIQNWNKYPEDRYDLIEDFRRVHDMGIGDTIYLSTSPTDWKASGGWKMRFKISYEQMERPDRAIQMDYFTKEA